MIRVVIASGSDVGTAGDIFWVNPGQVVAVGPGPTPGTDYRVVVQGQTDKNDLIITEPTDVEFAKQMQNFVLKTSQRIRELEETRTRQTPGQGDSISTQS
jgi:hypothetical protein